LEEAAKRYTLPMGRTPFDLAFEELADAGIEASQAARQKAEQAGVPIATLEDSEDGPTGDE